MRRFSIRSLMAVVVLVATGLAAFRNASDLWSGMTLLAAFGALGVSMLGAVILRGEERCWWGGFAFFCGSYLALTFGPWPGDAFRPKLGTTTLMKVAYGWNFQSPDLPLVKVVEINMDTGLSKSQFVRPTKPSFEHFQRVGHALFAILAGLVGGTVAAWFYARREPGAVVE